MLKRRLRLPLGAGLLRPYAAPARTCPFSRPAAVARRSISDDNHQDREQDEQLQQLRQQQELYQRAMSQGQQEAQDEQHRLELYEQQHREALEQQQQQANQQFYEDQQRYSQEFHEQQLPLLQQLQEEQAPFRSAQAGFQPQKTAFADDFVRAGVPGLYSPFGFSAALRYQENCIQQLNERIGGTKFATYESVLDVALDTSREASLAAVFNYASMTHNIGFYFDTISDKGVNAALGDEHAVIDMDKPKPQSTDEYAHIPKPLREKLTQSFGTMQNFRREMLEQANAMFGPGFVWLVRMARSPGAFTTAGYRVLVTYQAGSPYPLAHWRMQGTDMNLQAGVTERTGATIKDYLTRRNVANRRPQMYGQDAEAEMLDPLSRGNPGAAEVAPVLCVSTWEHAWMFDWGVENKRAFLDAWWNAIHWEKVYDRVLQLEKDKPKMGDHQRRVLQPQGEQLPPQDSPFQEARAPS